MNRSRSLVLASILLASCSEEPGPDIRLLDEIVNESDDVPAVEIVSRLDEILGRNPEGPVEVAARRARGDFAAFAEAERRLASSDDPVEARRALGAYLAAYPDGFRARLAARLLEGVPTRTFRARFYQALDGDPSIEHLEVAAHAVHGEDDPHARRLLGLSRAPELLLRVPDREVYAPLALAAGRIPFQSVGAAVPAVEVDQQAEVFESALYPGWGTLSRRRVTLRARLLEAGRETWSGTFAAEDPPLPDTVMVQNDDQGMRLLDRYERAVEDAAAKAGEALRERLGGAGPLRRREELSGEEWNEYLIHFVNLLQGDDSMCIPDEVLDRAQPDRPLLSEWRSASGQ